MSQELIDPKDKPDWAINSFVILADVPVTKRKKFTFVYNSQTEIIYTGKSFSDAWQFFLTTGCARVILVTEEKRTNISLGI